MEGKGYDLQTISSQMHVTPASHRLRSTTSDFTEGLEKKREDSDEEKKKFLMFFFLLIFYTNVMYFLQNQICWKNSWNCSILEIILENPPKFLKTPEFREKWKTLGRTEDCEDLQAFSQRGVWESFGHPIADFGHPNFLFLCIMQWMKKNWTPNSPQICIFGHLIHPKCVFWDTQFTQMCILGHPIHPNVYFWTPNSPQYFGTPNSPQICIFGHLIHPKCVTLGHPILKSQF